MRTSAGIVQGKGKIAKVERRSDFSTLHIQFPSQHLHGAKVGASIAINGTCLTVSLSPLAYIILVIWSSLEAFWKHAAMTLTAVDSLSKMQVTDVQGDLGKFDVIAETLRATNLGQLETASEVNFER